MAGMKPHPVLTDSRRSIKILASFSILLLGASTVVKAADAPQSKDLQLFYQQNCAGCHGADGAARDAAGGRLRGQDLTEARWRDATSDDEMVKAILKGKFFGLAMPAFKAVLTKDEALRMATEIIRKCAKGKPIVPLSKTASTAP